MDDLRRFSLSITQFISYAFASDESVCAENPFLQTERHKNACYRTSHTEDQRNLLPIGRSDRGHEYGQYHTERSHNIGACSIDIYTAGWCTVRIIIHLKLTTFALLATFDGFLNETVRAVTCPSHLEATATSAHLPSHTANIKLRKVSYK